MNAKDEKKVRTLARSLPVVYVKTKKTVNMFGSEMIKSGKHRDEAGFDIIPDKLYQIHVELSLPANHVERIKKVFKLQGEAGVAGYIREQHQLHKKQQAIINQSPVVNKKTNWFTKIKNFIWKIIVRHQSSTTA